MVILTYGLATTAPAEQLGVVVALNIIQTQKPTRKQLTLGTLESNKTQKKAPSASGALKQHNNSKQQTSRRRTLPVNYTR